MRITETAERESFRIWVICVIPPLVEQGAKDFIAGIINNFLPNIRWHDLRSTYCTFLLKEVFNPKAVSKLMGHAKELITMDVYTDNKGIIAVGVPEIEEYMKEVLPNLRDRKF